MSNNGGGIERPDQPELPSGPEVSLEARLRIARGNYTQEEFAELADLSRETVNIHENGHRPTPKKGVLKLWALASDVPGVTEEWLKAGKHVPHTPRGKLMKQSPDDPGLMPVWLTPLRQEQPA